MDSFSFICALSGLGISGGMPVRCLLLTESPYGDEDVRRQWVVRTPSLRAEYNDYGSIENINPEDASIADLWLRGLKEDLIEKGLGDNTCHDVAVFKDMTFDQLLAGLQEGRVSVRQDTDYFWRRPHDWRPRTLKTLREQVVETIETFATVANDPVDNAYIVDEPVPNLVRVRFGRYSNNPSHRLKEVKAALGQDLTAVLTAGSGNYPDQADLLVFFKPGKDRRGPAWGRAPGQTHDDKRPLDVRLAMVREDVWQALTAFPHQTYIAQDCIKCGKRPYEHAKGKCPGLKSKYDMGVLFPRNVPFVREGDGGYAWYGLGVYKYQLRQAWDAIVAHYQDEERAWAGQPRKQKPDAVEDATLQKILDETIKKRQEEEASFTPEQKEKAEKDREASRAAWLETTRTRLEHPHFGDYLLDAPALRMAGPGQRFFDRSTPGVIGIADHLSMCLADKQEVTLHLLDRYAEQVAIKYSMREVGLVWRPSASTGPRFPEVLANARFANAIADIARKDVAHQRSEGFRTARSYPRTLTEAKRMYKRRTR